jgi:SAM-dependent methyltransferase
VICVVCRSSDLRPDRHPELLRCASCGHRVYRRAGEVDSGALYGSGYHESEEYLDYAGQREVLAENFRDHLVRMARHGASGGRLLEVGCAYGFFLAEAAQRFEEAHGIDVSAGAVRYARERLGVSAEQGDVVRHRTPAPYDAVCLWDTIEHLADPRAALDSAARVLRPGGMLFLTTGDAGSLVARLRGRRWRMIHPPTHVHYFTRAGMRRLLADVGLAPVEIASTPVRRQVGNVLHNLDRFGRSLAVRAAARALLRHGPRGLLVRRLRLDLGDVMFVAARREAESAAA